MAEALNWIAIIDDDPAVLAGLTRLLRAHTFHTRTYGSAHEFLGALPREIPDCLIIDLKMPGMSGLELHQRLRQMGIHIPTIVMTAQGDAEMRSRCEQAGTVAFLAKPLQDTSLFAALEVAGKVSRPRQSLS
jgi:FixJ family two-component response regulator